MKWISMLISLSFVSSAQARDLGYRYVSGKCVDAKGNAGLNPGFVGPCGDMRGVIMARFNFEEVDLSGADFTSADLQEATFKGAQLAGTKFVSANLSGVEFDGANIIGADFSKANLINSHLAGAKFKDVDFSGVDLSGASLSYLELPGCRLKGANLGEAALDHANLSGGDLSGATLTAANLAGAKLDGANLEKADFVRADLSGASLVEVRASEIRLNYALMHRVLARSAQFSKASMVGAQLDNADLRQAQLQGADLRSANLQNMQTTGADFTNARFNKRTVLPFTQDDAKRLGMILAQSGNLLVILDSNGFDLTALKNFLNSEGADLVVASQLHSSFDGSASLGDYGAILHVLSTDYSTDMPASGQTAILNFVKAGGIYIATQWTGYALEFPKGLQVMKDLILFTYSTSINGEIRYVPVIQKAAHPMLDGINAPFAISETHSQSPVRAVEGNPIETLIVDDSGNPMLAVRDVGKGHSVNFAIALGTRSPGWTSPGLQRLILNAVNWQ